jgi:catechol 2,3-dioxygenase
LILKGLLDAGYPIDGASDHDVSEAFYLRGPDQNGVEPASNRPWEAWSCTKERELAMTTWPLDSEGLLAELDGVEGHESRTGS